MGFFWKTGGASTIFGLLVTVVLISCKVVLTSPVPQETIHAVKPCNEDCQQKSLGNPFETYPGTREGIGPTLNNPSPDLYSETLKEKPDTTVEKKLSGTYDIGLFSTICWAQITTVTEYLNGSEPTIIVEYAISFETPSNIPDKYTEHTDRNNKYIHANTRRSYAVPFETVEKSDTQVIKQSRNVTCGSGPLYTKEILFWPTKNKTRLEIRVSPKLKSLAVDCSESTETPNSFSPRLFQDETTSTPITTPTVLENRLEQSEKVPDMETVPENNKHVETTLNIVNNILGSHKVTTLPPDVNKNEVEHLDTDRMINDVTNVVVSQTTPVTFRTLPDETISNKEEKPEGNSGSATPKSSIPNQHVDDTERLIKHIADIIATEVSVTTTTTETSINTRISPDVPETTMTPVESNTEEYEYEDESCEDTEENTETASEESLSTLSSTNDAFAKAILKEAKKSKPNADILENLGPVDKNPEKQKLIENITMEILHDLLTSNSSETSTTKLADTSVPEIRIDTFGITSTTQMPTTNEPEKKSPVDLITQIIKEIAQDNNSTQNVTDKEPSKFIVREPEDKDSGDIIANRVTPGLGEDIPAVIMRGSATPTIINEEPGKKRVYKKKPKQKSSNLMSPGSVDSSEEMITEIEDEPSILRKTTLKPSATVSSEEHISDEIVTEIIEESQENTKGTEAVKNVPSYQEDTNKLHTDGHTTLSSQLETRMASDLTTIPSFIVKHTTIIPELETQKPKDKEGSVDDILSSRTTPDLEEEMSNEGTEESTNDFSSSETSTSKTGNKSMRKKQLRNKLSPRVQLTTTVNLPESMEEVTEIVESDSDEHVTNPDAIHISSKPNSTDGSLATRMFKETTEAPLEYTTLHTQSTSSSEPESESEDFYDLVTETDRDSSEVSTNKEGHKVKKMKKRKRTQNKINDNKSTPTVQSSIATRIGLGETSESSETTTTFIPVTPVVLPEEKVENISTRMGSSDKITTIQPKSTETSTEKSTELYEYIDITSTERNKNESKIADMNPSHDTSTDKVNETVTKRKKPRKYKRIHIRRRKPGHGKPVETKIISEETISEDDYFKKGTKSPELENGSPKIKASTTAIYEENPSKGSTTLDYTTTDNPTGVVSRIGVSASDVSTTKSVDNNVETNPIEISDGVTTITPNLSEVKKSDEFLFSTPGNEKKKRAKVVYRRKKHPKTTPHLESVSEETTTHESSSDQTENISSTDKEATVRFEMYATNKPNSENSDAIKTETSTEFEKRFEEFSEKMEKELLSTTIRNRETSTESVFYEDSDDYPEADKKKIQEAFIKELIKDLEPEENKNESTPSPFSGDSISTRMLSPSAPSPTVGLGENSRLELICDPNNPSVSGSSVECAEYRKKNANDTKPHFIAKSKKNDKIICYDVGILVKQITCPENTSNLPLIDNIHTPSEELTTPSPYLIKISKLEKLLDMLCTKKLHRLRSKLVPQPEAPRTTRRNNEIKYKLSASSEKPEILNDRARHERMLHYPNYRTIKRRELSNIELLDFLTKN